MGISQVFVFIVAAIMFAFILIFGYNAITDFLEKGETVEFYQFKSSLENSVQQIYSEYGAVRQEDYFLPVDYEQVCFVDLDSTPDSSLASVDPIAYDVWTTAHESSNPEERGYAAADENVFLKPGAPVAIKVYKLDLQNSDGQPVGYLCQNISKGQFTLRLEGKGSRTLLTPPLYN